MKYIILLSFLFYNNLLFSKCESLPILVKAGKTISAFVPKGWIILDSAFADFNNDKMKDAVIVLSTPKSENRENDLNECIRAIVILQKTNTGYTLNTFCNNAILCLGCGGVFGDPYEGISLNKNVLKISHYGGSNWRWSTNYTFRFQNNKWVLIGAKHDSYFNASDCDGTASAGDAARNMQEVNFSTSKAHIIKTKTEECKPYKDYIANFKKKAIVEFRNFSVDNNYFPFSNDDSQ
jgi:hypothetical protein